MQGEKRRKSDKQVLTFEDSVDAIQHAQAELNEKIETHARLCIVGARKNLSSVLVDSNFNNIRGCIENAFCKRLSSSCQFGTHADYETFLTNDEDNQSFMAQLVIVFLKDEIALNFNIDILLADMGNVKSSGDLRCAINICSSDEAMIAFLKWLVQFQSRPYDVTKLSKEQLKELKRLVNRIIMTLVEQYYTLHARVDLLIPLSVWQLTLGRNMVSPDY